MIKFKRHPRLTLVEARTVAEKLNHADRLERAA